MFACSEHVIEYLHVVSQVGFALLRGHRPIAMRYRHLCRYCHIVSFSYELSPINILTYHTRKSHSVQFSWHFTALS